MTVTERALQGIGGSNGRRDK